MSKLKFAFYWAASCGGCDIAVLDINEKILDVAKIADILLWPVAMDFKYKDVEAMPDKHIDVCFFNGAIRNSEQEHIAHLLRKKSKVMVAFGACAAFGGIPGLANLTSKEEILETVYEKTASTHNPEKTRPQTKLKVKEGELTLPVLYNKVYALHQHVPVEYFVPGCPPTPKIILAAVTAIAENKLPPVGSTIASSKSLCEECPREKSDTKKIKKFYRPQEIITDPKKCLLEQGLLCMGPATRGGCEAQCISVNMPCRGCFGPTEKVSDQGAKLVSAIASIIDSSNPEEIDKIINGIADPIGTFYRFTLPTSLLGSKQTPDCAGKKEKQTNANLKSKETRKEKEEALK